MGNTKGAVLVEPIKFLRKRREEARALLAPELYHYLEEHVRLSSWYPETDFVALVRAAMQLIPGDPDAAMESMGAAGAHFHAEVYGDLLTSVSSNSSVFALWSSQHDTGELRAVWESPSAARIELSGFDSPSHENCTLCTGYIRGALAVNGFDAMSIEKPLCMLRGDDRCVWRVSWKNPDATPVTPVRRRAR
ncbi:MAG: hypothetical protein ACHQ6T_12800 [Myxococcota bacterium]